MLNESAPIWFPMRPSAVVIGASAGGVNALDQVLRDLPSSTPFPIVVVVHVPPSAPSLFVALFSKRCAMQVREPCDKEPVTPAVWFAPPGYHLLIEPTRTFAMSIDPPVNHSRPSIDVLFDSAAVAYGSELLAIVLTGANADGAAGAAAIRDSGGFVVVQDPATAEAAFMPLQAKERARPQSILTLPEIGRALAEVASRGVS